MEEVAAGFGDGNRDRRQVVEEEHRCKRQQRMNEQQRYGEKALEEGHVVDQSAWEVVTALGNKPPRKKASVRDQ